MFSKEDIYKEKVREMQRQIEDESLPLYKREQLVWKLNEFKKKHFPNNYWNSSKYGTLRKRKEDK